MTELAVAIPLGMSERLLFEVPFPTRFQWDKPGRRGMLVVAFTSAPPKPLAEDERLGMPLVAGTLFRRERLVVRYESDKRSQPSGRFDHAICGERRAPTPAEIVSYRNDVLTWLSQIERPNIRFAWSWSGRLTKIVWPDGTARLRDEQ